MRREKDNEFGNQDKKEKGRKLTAAEQRRLQRFETSANDLVQQGYRRTELTVGIIKANVFAVLLLIPLFLVGFGLSFVKNGIPENAFRIRPFALFAIVFIALIVVHELIHGLSWSLFTEHHWKDIEFGLMKEYLTPYCACCTPLAKGPYIFGALMPLVLLGILPMGIGILTGSYPVLLLGIIMADSAAGDIMIVWNILRYKSKAKSIFYIDHPTQAGGIIFEKG